MENDHEILKIRLKVCWLEPTKAYMNSFCNNHEFLSRLPKFARALIK